MLGVSKSADDEQIKRAYRDLARKYHPDTNKEAGAEARFKEAQHAYEVLKDAKRRKYYDQFGVDMEDSSSPVYDGGAGAGGGGNGRRKKRGAQPTSGGFDFGSGNPFADFFRQHVGGAKTTQQDWATPFESGPQRGANVEAEITVTLREAALGGSRSVSLRAADGRTRSLEVTIPKGTVDGSVMRLAGQGEPGLDGGPSGDLLLRVKTAPDSRFTVSGVDLTTVVPLAPWEAALGCEVTVPTLEGDLTVTIPPGASSGQRLRLRGKGLPQRSGAVGGATGAGDLFVELKILTPKNLSAAQREAWERLRDVSNFQARTA